jgi:UDP-3-O-[3-hydroxymyristoyl] N-acetylglucosamine deacetylase
MHSGAPTSVRFEARPGPLLFRLGPDQASIEELEVVRADQGVCLKARHGSHEVDVCEHLLAALAGLGVRSGLLVSLPGPEVPLLDGCAHELARALSLLAPRRDPPPLVVAQRAEIVHGSSRYRFEPAAGARLEVEVEFPGDPATMRAEHSVEDVGHFVSTIARARTFGFESDAERLRARGRARHVDPAAVVVLDAQGRALAPSAPLADGELAHHKLLDLMGDLYLYGGPPLGCVWARRPGHEATHRVTRKALDQGVLVRAQAGPAHSRAGAANYK